MGGPHVLHRRARNGTGLGLNRHYDLCDHCGGHDRDRDLNGQSEARKGCNRIHTHSRMLSRRQVGEVPRGDPGLTL